VAGECDGEYHRAASEISSERCWIRECNGIEWFGIEYWSSGGIEWE
jgi:hypothetical protein